jgi:NodT family efflux transporter outer membrane factor (OMF) lipoprotein
MDATRAADLRRWWATADDPLLPALVEAALRDHPSLATAAARVAAARAGLAQAEAISKPQLGAEASALRARSTPQASPVSSAAAGLAASWEIDLFGARGAEREAAAQRLRSAEAAAQATRIGLAAETASSYVALRACQAQLAQAQTDARSRAETVRVTEVSVQAGLLAPASAALARASAAQGRAQASAQSSACDSARKALVVLTGLPEADLIARLGEAPAAAVPRPGPMSALPLPAALLDRRPDLIAARAAIDAALADRRAADASALPRVGLNGSIGLAALRVGGGSSEGLTWSIGPLALQWALIDGGARAARSAAAQAGIAEAVASYRAQARQAVREVEETLVALQGTAERDADARSAAEDFQRSFRAVEARFKGGVASVFELEDARRSVIAAQSALIELQRERMNAWINLYRVIGGGT